MLYLSVDNHGFGVCTYLRVHRHPGSERLGVCRDFINSYGELFAVELELLNHAAGEILPKLLVLLAVMGGGKPHQKIDRYYVLRVAV